MCTQICKHVFRHKVCAHLQMCNTACRCQKGDTVCGDKYEHLHRFWWLERWSILAADAKRHRQLISYRLRGRRSHMTTWPVTVDFSELFSFYSKIRWPFSHRYLCKRPHQSTHKAPSWHLWICFKHLQVGAQFTREYVCKIVHTFTKSQLIYRHSYAFTSSPAATKIPQHRLHGNNRWRPNQPVLNIIKENKCTSVAVCLTVWTCLCGGSMRGFCYLAYLTRCVQILAAMTASLSPLEWKHCFLTRSITKTKLATHSLFLTLCLTVKALLCGLVQIIFTSSSC